MHPDRSQRTGLGTVAASGGLPDRIDLHRADGRAVARGRVPFPAEQEPGYRDGQYRDSPQPVNAPHVSP